MNDERILIVDDEPLTRKSLYEILRYEGYSVSCAASAQEALTLMDEESPSIVISDLKMPNMGGLELLRKIKSVSNDVSVVIITGYGSIETAVEAMKEGAFDYITKPILDNEIKIVIKRIFEQKKLLEENRFLKKKLEKGKRARFYDIIGQNSEMQKIYSLIETIAPTNASVLIQGESGTGKRLIAQAIHYSDVNRKDNPFVEVSCGALPETLLESELFGHVKGAFTSAIKDRQGRFEAADGGTIFLDEIDTFSPQLQVKLLRVLQEGEFERVGDTRTLRADVRVLAATNQSLEKLIKKNLFREDLYYRLNVIPINVPPLRMRVDDIPMLIEHFLRKCSQKINKKVTSVADDAMEFFARYKWPGNVRELENIIERAVILSKGETLSIEDLPDEFKNMQVESFSVQGTETTTLKDALRQSEKEIIEGVLKKCNGNRKNAAQTLGINRTTLYNKMKEYGLLDKNKDSDNSALEP